MTDRIPAYRYHVTPFGKVDDGVHITIQVRRVDGDPEGGPFGLRRSPIGITLDLLVAELRDVLARMRPSDDPRKPKPYPLPPSLPVVDGRVVLPEDQA